MPNHLSTFQHTSCVHQPVAVNLVKKFDLSFNILKATIYPRKEGLMVLELSGHRKNFQRGVRYLKSIGIKVESIGQDIKRNEKKCFQCGACTAVVPQGLFISRDRTWKWFLTRNCVVRVNGVCPHARHVLWR